jgi:hypothetical protein
MTNPTEQAEAEVRRLIVEAGGDPDAVIDIAASEEEHWSRAIVECSALYGEARNIAVVARAEGLFVASYLRSGARDGSLMALAARDLPRLERSAPKVAAVLAAAMRIVMACAAVKAGLDPSSLFQDWVPAAQLN